MNQKTKIDKSERSLHPNKIALKWIKRALRFQSFEHLLMSMDRDPQTPDPKLSLAQELLKWQQEQDAKRRRSGKTPPNETAHRAFAHYLLFQNINREVWFRSLNVIPLLCSFELWLRRIPSLVHIQKIPVALEDETANAIEGLLQHHVCSWEEYHVQVRLWYRLDSVGPSDGARNSTETVAQETPPISQLRWKGAPLKSGRLVELSKIPFRKLKQIPLVDGKWIDMHFIELAEFGALVKDEEFDAPSLALHPLALSIYQAPCTPEAVRRENLHAEVKSNMSTFPGKKRKIGGRSYGNIDDYERWAGRMFKGELKFFDGIDAGSWNEMIDEMVKEGRTPKVSGITLRKLQPPFTAVDFYRVGYPGGRL